MTRRPVTPPASEATDAGEQTLVPGVDPVSLRERLEALAAKPVAPKRGPVPQAPCDIGLFNEAARNQLDLIDRLRATTTPTEKE